MTVQDVQGFLHQRHVNHQQQGQAGRQKHEKARHVRRAFIFYDRPGQLATARCIVRVAFHSNMMKRP